jgi:hypothetical protein
LIAPDRAPGHKAFPAGSKGSDAGLDAIGDDEDFVTGEQRGNVAFIGLELTEGVADGGVLVGHILELEKGERDAVHKNDDVGAAIGAIFNDGELIDGSPIVVFRFIKVEEFDEIVNDAAFLAILDIDAICEELMKAAIAFFEARTNDAREFADGIGDCVGRDFGIDARKGFFESA